jgi:putrescine transport system ATP-binding protein
MAADAAAMPAIAVAGVSKRFGEVRAVDGVTLEIARGEFFCLLGASGSGKTTLLRMMAGFECPDGGRISIDGEDVTLAPPYRRPVNMMFQSYALFPHLTVARNVAFGLEEEGRPKAEIRTRVAAALDLLDMGGLGDRKPHQLSGGQSQRAALARALVKEPKILLLDEPLAALDKRLRERAQSELVVLRKRLGITFVVVTHDQEEAMGMASRIALMRDGAVLQVGSPRDLYENPVSRYAAEFFGAANLFEGRVARADGPHVSVECDVLGPLQASGAGGVSPGSPVAVMVRPEHVKLSCAPAGEANVFPARLDSLSFLGSFYVGEAVLAQGQRVSTRLSPAEYAAAGTPDAGEDVSLSFSPQAARVMTR